MRRPGPVRRVKAAGFPRDKWRGTAAAENEFRGECALATKLVNELVGPANAKILTKTSARYGAR